MSARQINLSSDKFSWEELVLSRRILVRKLLYRGTPEHLGSSPASGIVRTGPEGFTCQTCYPDQTPVLPVSLSPSASFPTFSPVYDLGVFCPTVYSYAPNRLLVLLRSFSF